MTQKQLSREEYYFQVIEAVRLRGTCDRGQSGAILVKDNRIISTGYVGSPSKTPHCDEVGHEMMRKGEFDHCIRSIHAELNAIIQCAKYGPSCNGAVMYSTMFPCYDCAKAIINAGVIAVNSAFDYKASGPSKDLFDKVGIPWFIRTGETIPYEAQVPIQALMTAPDRGWKILICCILLNRARRVVMEPILKDLLERWPTPEHLANAPFPALTELVKPLGMYTARANYLVWLSRQWADGIRSPGRFKGIGTYGLQAWRIFVDEDLDFTPSDRKLRAYVERVRDGQIRVIGE